MYKNVCQFLKIIAIVILILHLFHSLNMLQIVLTQLGKTQMFECGYQKIPGYS